MRFGPRSLRPGIASLLALLALAAAAAAAPGAAPDPEQPPVKPLPGARAIKRSTHGFDEYWMALGRLVGDGQAMKHAVLEGRWTHAAYAGAEGRSVAEVLQHYERQLLQAGFEVLYACKGLECGEGGRKTNGDWWPLSDHRRFLVARLPRQGGDLWVSVHVHARRAGAPVMHELDVIEEKPPAAPTRPRDESDFATLQQELQTQGRIVLRSLRFVDGRPQVRSESEGVVRAIAELLAREPGLRLHVVVHSDDAVPTEQSLELTRKRAAAVVTLLTRGHRVPSARLRAAGVGPLAPLASNASEEGRALNRRVELVPQSADREAAARVGNAR